MTERAYAGGAAWSVLLGVLTPVSECHHGAAPWLERMRRLTARNVGKECSGRESFKSHVSMSHEALDESSHAFFSEKQIHKEIASQWLGVPSQARSLDAVAE